MPSKANTQKRARSLEQVLGLRPFLSGVFWPRPHRQLVLGIDELCMVWRSVISCLAWDYQGVFTSIILIDSAFIRFHELLTVHRPEVLNRQSENIANMLSFLNLSGISACTAHMWLDIPIIQSVVCRCLLSCVHISFYVLTRL